jgi:POT family proton-dependent oligopeptide transporter
LRDKHPADAIAGVRSVLRVLVLFALVTPFWSSFDQKASTSIITANMWRKVLSSVLRCERVTC